MTYKIYAEISELWSWVLLNVAGTGNAQRIQRGERCREGLRYLVEVRKMVEVLEYA